MVSVRSASLRDCRLCTDDCCSYIPVKLDYSDLHDIAVFFVGLPDGTGSHDELAKSIAENGKMFASEHWREADMYVPI